MNIIDIILIILIGIIIIKAIFTVIRNKKNGKGCSCGCGCGSCSGCSGSDKKK